MRIIWPALIILTAFFICSSSLHSAATESRFASISALEIIAKNAFACRRMTAVSVETMAITRQMKDEQ